MLVFIGIAAQEMPILNIYKLGGVKIGKGTVCMKPTSIAIDMSRPELVEIGEHVFIHRGTTILTHDWASWCFIPLYADFIPSHGRVKIGNNVWFGESCTVLKGVTIGDNCIIGLGSVVTKDIPSNSVAVGCPARVICTIEEYYEKRKSQYEAEVIEYAQAIRNTGREPAIEDFYDDYPLFVDGKNIHDYPDYPYLRVFENDATLEKWSSNHNAKYRGFDDFIKSIKASQ